jgi:hypothetical protein
MVAVRRPTFDVSGGCRRAKRAASRPLDEGVRSLVNPHRELYAQLFHMGSAINPSRERTHRVVLPDHEERKPLRT